MWLNKHHVVIHKNCLFYCPVALLTNETIVNYSMESYEVLTGEVVQAPIGWWDLMLLPLSTGCLFVLVWALHVWVLIDIVWVFVDWLQTFLFRFCHVTFHLLIPLLHWSKIMPTSKSIKLPKALNPNQHPIMQGL